MQNLEKKLPWLVFNDLKEELKKSKDHLDQAKRQLAEKETELRASAEPLR